MNPGSTARELELGGYSRQSSVDSGQNCASCSCSLGLNHLRRALPASGPYSIFEYPYAPQPGECVLHLCSVRPNESSAPGAPSIVQILDSPVVFFVQSIFTVPPQRR